MDQVVLTSGSTFDLHTVQVNFNFLGTTDPNAFAASGLLDMDTFLRSSNGGVESGLSSTFAPNQSWNTVLSQASFSATSSYYDVQLALDPSGGGDFGIKVTPVPEPATWALWLAGAAVLVEFMRRRRAVA